MQKRTIDVAEAKRLLATIPATYREPSSAVVARLTRLIATGTFNTEASAHDPIRLDLNGTVRNGRMRLMAVVDADTPADMWFYQSPPAETWQATAPSLWWADDELVPAIRFTGHNAEDIIGWMAGHTETGSFAEYREADHRFSVSVPGRLPVHAYPGDWIVRTGHARYSVHGHQEFENGYFSRLEDFEVGQEVEVTFTMTIHAITPGRSPALSVGFAAEEFGDGSYRSVTVPLGGTDGVRITKVPADER